MALVALSVLFGVATDLSHLQTLTALRKMMNALVLVIANRLGFLGKCQRHVQVRKVEMGGRRI
jgi:hypothetical protein